MTDSDQEDNFSKCFEKISAFKESLPSRVDPAQISVKAKIPFKAISFREALIHRVTELSDSAFTFLTMEGKAVSGFILTRAVYETMALLFVLHTNIKRVVDSKAVGDFDEYIMTHTFGWRKEGEDNLPTMPNILGAIDKVDKFLDGHFRREYEAISEYCHPNCAGVHSSYVKIDKENIYADIGSQFTKTETMHAAGTLLSTLEMFEYFYNEISGLMADFVSICEGELDAKT